MGMINPILSLFRTKEFDQNFILTGIQSQNDIGFLSINEYYRYLEIGTNFKNPIFPVWVIFFQQRFSIILGWTSEVKREGNKWINKYFIDAFLKNFDLIYLDNEKEQILKVIRGSKQFSVKNLSERAEGVENVLKSKWGKKVAVEFRPLVFSWYYNAIL